MAVSTFSPSFLSTIRSFATSFMGPLLVLAGLLLLFYAALSSQSKIRFSYSPVLNFCTFFYSSFLKPHSKDDSLVGQQGALESFYKVQVHDFSSMRNASILTTQSGQCLRRNSQAASLWSRGHAGLGRRPAQLPGATGPFSAFQASMG